MEAGMSGVFFGLVAEAGCRMICYFVSIAEEKALPQRHRDTEKGLFTRMILSPWKFLYAKQVL
jgi:hypothetical protein